MSRPIVVIACMAWLLRIVGALTAPHICGARAPVEEPSTASRADLSLRLSPYHLLCNFTGVFDEQPRHWIERAILQGNDPVWYRINRQAHRQDLEVQALCWEVRYGSRSNREKTARCH